MSQYNSARATGNQCLSTTYKCDVDRHPPQPPPTHPHPPPPPPAHTPVRLSRQHVFLLPHATTATCTSSQPAPDARPTDPSTDSSLRLLGRRLSPNTLRIFSSKNREKHITSYILLKYLPGVRILKLSCEYYLEILLPSFEITKQV